MLRDPATLTLLLAKEAVEYFILHTLYFIPQEAVPSTCVECEPEETAEEPMADIMSVKTSDENKARACSSVWRLTVLNSM